jgi:hypothetical protein
LDVGENWRDGRAWLSPAVLISGDNLKLVKHGKVVASAEGGGLIAPFPTESTVEQIVMTLDASKSLASLYSTTEWSIEKLAEFSVYCPHDVDWVDVRKVDKLHILYWGGTDHMKGGVTWSNCVGVNEKLEFCEVDSVKAETVAESFKVKNGQDLRVHGNMLTMLRQHEEVDDFVRSFKSTTTIVCDSKIVIIFKGSLDDVWGTPQQFVALQKFKDASLLRFFHNRLEVADYSLDFSDSRSICVLYAHSR